MRLEVRQNIGESAKGGLLCLNSGRRVTTRERFWALYMRGGICISKIRQKTTPAKSSGFEFHRGACKLFCDLRAGPGRAGHLISIRLTDVGTRVWPLFLALALARLAWEMHTAWSMQRI